MFPPCVAAEAAQPVATVAPSVLNVQQGQRAEFRCSVTGKPTPAIEWIGTTTLNSNFSPLWGLDQCLSTFFEAWHIFGNWKLEKIPWHTTNPKYKTTLFSLIMTIEYLN